MAKAPIRTFCAAILPLREVGKRGIGVLIAVAVGLAACSGGSKAAVPRDSSVSRGSGSSASATTAHPGPTTTTSRPEYSFDDSVPPPKLLNTGTNYVAIVKSLEIYGNWLSAHRPDLAFGPRILRPDPELLVLFSRDLVRLRDSNASA